jgi:translation initiation factor 4E
MEGEEPHPLTTSWNWYEHLVDKDGQKQWVQKMRQLGSTASAEEFWSYFEHVPPPSELFQHGVCVGRQVESLSIFREGVLPKWEDPMNEQGGEWFARKPFPPAILDALWELIVVSMVSDALDQRGGIMGARVVDKSAPRRAVYRLEVWYSSQANPEDVRTQLLHTLSNVPVHVKDGGTAQQRRKLAKHEIPKFELRSHEVQKAVELQKDLGLMPHWKPSSSAPKSSIDSPWD